VSGLLEGLPEMGYQLEALARVAGAMLLGGLIGLERERAGRAAGFRTQMLVAGAACLLVALSHGLVHHFEVSGDGSALSADPTRIVQAIVVGISFLGAGTIVRSSEGDEVRGLTTAASILLASGVGIAVALSELVLAAGTTALVLAVLGILRVVERRLLAQRDG